MKILALVTDGFGGHGGIAQYNRDLITAMSDSPRVREVVVLPRSSACVPLPSCVRELKPVRGRVLYILHACGRGIWESFDAVFCGHLFAAPLAAALARAQKVPLWIQLHGIEAWTCPGALVKVSLEQAALVTAVSRYTRTRALEWADIKPARLRVIPNTVSDAYRPRREKPVRLVGRYELTNKKVILTVSRICSAERYKGHERVLHAMPDIIKEHPEAIYMVVGSGDDEGRLRQLVDLAGLREHVRFVGHVRTEDLADHYSVADVFVMPSTGEGFGIVYLEAAACGVPVIAGKCAGSVDALADGKVGALIDPTDAGLIAATVSAALRGEMTEKVNEVRRFAYANFSQQVDRAVRRVQGTVQT